MNDYAVLAYLDFCRGRNWVRNVVRAPGRLAMWGLYVLWFGVMLYSRAEIGALHNRVTGVAEPLATVLFFGFVFAAGAVTLRAANGQVGAFSSAADARFLSASQLDERAVVTWLQLRSSAALTGRFLFLIILYTMVFNRVGTFGGMLLSMVAAAAFLGSISIPALALSNRIGPGPANTLAWILIAAGALPAALAALPYAHVATPLNALGARILALHFGKIVSSLLLGNAPLIVSFWVLACGMIVAAHVLATDLYPELYEASLTGFARRDRIRAYGRGHRPDAYKRTRAGKTPAALNGGWAVIWKDWIALRRAKRFVPLLAISAAFWIVAGAGAAFALRGNGDAADLFIAFFAVFTNIVLIFIVSEAVTLAADLRKPIWWLTPDGLRVRLYAWVISGSWRLAAGFSICLVAFCAVNRTWLPLEAGLPAAVVLPLVVRCVSLATYAIVPAPADQRGPMALLRLLTMYGLLLPPAAAGALCGFALHNLYAAILAATLVALGEAAPLVEFATWRIGGNGAAFALAESGA